MKFEPRSRRAMRVLKVLRISLPSKKRFVPPFRRRPNACIACPLNRRGSGTQVIGGYEKVVVSAVSERQIAISQYGQRHTFEHRHWYILLAKRLDDATCLCSMKKALT